MPHQDETYVLTQEQKDQLLMEFNQTQKPYPKGKTLHQLFEEQVWESPDRIALTYEGEEWTYAQLNAWANQLARLLRAKGIGRGQIIGLLTDRSCEMIASMLGVLKAGAAYMPIDVDLPAERIRYMLADADAPLLLTQAEIADGLFAEEPCGTEVLTVDDPILSEQDPSNLESVNTPDDACYVIYTSGTTGRPKGSLIAHSNVVNLIKASDCIEITPDDTFLLLSNYAFDGSVYDIYASLLHGARLVLIPKDTVIDMPELARVIREQKVTSFVSTVVLFNALVDYDVDCLTGIKGVFIGGERMSAHHARKAYEHIGPGKVINVYGPTEATVFAVTYTVDGWAKNQTSVPIGKPIANGEVYVLDELQRLVPPGEIGELYIAGDGVGKGYLNREELTREKFIPHLFKPEGFMYRTGDLVKWLPDGNMAYIDRIDTQVKIRGYRIELGEIETLLNSHPQVKDSVVIAREDEPNQRYLCAYIAADQEIDTAEIKAELSLKLPPYMIPTHIITLDALPMTTNGKVDKRALPKPEFTSTGVEYVAPRDETEEALAAVWMEVLHVGSVGIHDHFFDLGGHSLIAGVLVSQLQKRFHIVMKVRDLFVHDTIAKQADFIREAEKREHPSIPRCEEQQSYPVTSAQKRMLILHEMEGTGLAYHIPMVFDLEGEVDAGRLEHAFQQLIDRHESLRTSFQWIEGEPVQCVEERAAFQLAVSKQTSSAFTDKKELIDKAVAKFQQPFLLDQAPLLRAELLTYRDDGLGHLLLLDIHHIISDGVSMTVLFDELSQIYAGETLPEQPIQYKDFAVWQAEAELTTQDERGQEQQAIYWLDKLSGELPSLQLPTDFSRPSVQSFAGMTLAFDLDQELSRALHQLAQQTGTTLYMVLLAAYQVLLGKYSGQEEVIVGSPIAGRAHADVQSIVGLFVNTLVMRGYPTAAKTFKEFLAEVKTDALHAFENQDVPLEELVEMLNIPRDPSRNPIFDVMFVLQNMGSTIPSLDGVTVTPYEAQYHVSKMDITLTAVEEGDGLQLRWTYCTKLFRAQTIERMAKHFTEMLRAITSNPDRRLRELDMLTAGEKEALLAFNQTAQEHNSAPTTHQMLEEQAARFPYKVAVICQDQELTYQQLNEKANQLARHLRAKGVQPNDIVALVIQPSVEMVIAVFAVMKAGGAYLPIDVEHPMDRIAYMLRDSQSKMVLTQRDVAQEIGVSDVLFVDDQSLYQGDSSNPDPVNSPDDLVYVIYTSGTTGKPKGVLLEHRGLVNYVNWFTAQAGTTNQDRAALVSSYGFDLGYTSLYPSLLNGGTLVIVAKEIYQHPIRHVEYLTEQQVTYIKMTPSLFQTVVNALVGSGEPVVQTAKLNALRLIVLGGEKINAHDVATYHTYVPHTTFMNHYGPTEATIGCIATPLDWDTLSTFQARPVIGRPIHNTRIYLLDQQGQPVPAGIAGEIHIAGAGLARGYLNLPELTEEKFVVADRLGRTERLYRTGDLGRYSEDGSIEYIGRADHQVKIRGYRVEPSEIAHALQQHEQVEKAVVIAHDAGSLELELVAYLVTTDRMSEREPVSVAELRAFLQQHLPAYMIPSAFLFLEAFPLTANGKVDLQALPTPDTTTTRDTEYDAPVTYTEKKLEAIWKSILGLPHTPIGVNDNFFGLGGHSLKGMILLSQIHKTFDVEMPLRTIFQAPTIRQLANEIQQLSATEGFTTIEPAAVQDDYPVSFAQKRQLILHQLNGAELSYNMPLMMTLDGELDIQRLEAALQELMNRHESLRTSFDWIDGEPVQRIHPSLDFHLLREQVSEDELTAKTNAFIQPFTLNLAPLFRAGLLTYGADRHILMLDMHHIISDGVSLHILFDELTELYHGEGGALPALRIQYKDFAVWQHSSTQTKRMEKQEAYWLDTLSGELPVLELATDFLRPPVQSFEGEIVSLELDHELTHKLEQLAVQTGTSAYMVLLAVFQVLLSRYSGQEDILVGSPIAGRPHADLEPIVGMFVNTLVLRGQPTAEKPFRAFLEEIKETTLSAFEHQEYPFEKVVEKLNIARDVSRHPLFDVMFTMQNTGRELPELDGVVVGPYETGYHVAKFDLTLTAEQKADTIQLTIDYATKLFARETVERLTGHFQQIVQAVTEHPDMLLGHINMLTDSETHQLLVEFNQSKTNCPKEKTLHQLFEEQVENHPDRIAMSFDGMTMTYGELNARANQMAYYLISQGVKQQDVVGLMVERSFEMQIAILGILKAGAAYLPIDPEFPADRIEYMLEDSQAVLLVTQPEWIGTVAGHLPVITVRDEAVAEQETTNLGALSTSDDICYIIYTSGTTGKPKGILNTHANISRVVKETNYIEISPESTFLQLSNYAFDGCTFDTYGALLNGAKLVLIAKETVLDIPKLAQVIRDEEIHHFFSTVVLFNALVEHDVDCLQHVKKVLVGGERLSLPHIRKALDRIGPGKLANG